jgi:hypothetical protein
MARYIIIIKFINQVAKSILSLYFSSFSRVIKRYMNIKVGIMVKTPKTMLIGYVGTEEVRDRKFTGYM